MRHTYRLGLVIAFCFGLSTVELMAQENTNVRSNEFSKVGSTAGTFLTIPVGARAMALGVFSSIADDPTALYWNPAGITQMAGTSASYSYDAMFAGLTHNFAGVIFPISESYKVGLSATTLSSGDIPITDLFNDKGTGATYSVRDLAFGISLAGQLTEQFSFGVTGKFVNLGIYNLSANGIAFDFGTLYKPGILGLRIAFGVQNLSGPVKYTGPGLVRSSTIDQTSGNQNPDAQLEADEASLPLTFRAALASDVMEGNDMNSLVLSTEFATSAASSESVGIGAEYVWNKLLAVRAGYMFGSADAYGISGGVGVKYETGGFYGAIDYGIRPHKTLGLINQITASLRFQ